MSILFGTLNCNNCQTETRFLVDLGDIEKRTYLLGHTYPKNIGSKEVECDYCNATNRLHVVKIDDRISAFLNNEEYKRYENGQLHIKKANQDAGIKSERKKRTSTTRKVYSLDFDTHPLTSDETIKLDQTEWIVKKIYRKEWTETDIDKRMNSPMIEEYWYEVKNKKNEHRWLIVTEAEENNAYLQIEHPTLRDEKEIKIDITDQPIKPELILDCEWTNNLYVEAYEYKTGVRLLVVNEQNEIEMDLYKSSIEEAIQELEELMELEVD